MFYCYANPFLERRTLTEAMMKEKPTVKNAKLCTVCGKGTVDKYEFYYEYRKCGAQGDPFTGMMVSKESLTLKRESK